MGKLELLIGMSLSLCVADIIVGLVQESQVVRIIAATDAREPWEIEKVLDDYSKGYWRENPELGKEIARRLFDSGRVDQPRTRGEQHPGLATKWKKADEPDFDVITVHSSNPNSNV